MSDNSQVQRVVRAPRNRGPGRPFKPGQSGNLKGRPPAPPEVVACRAGARAYVPAVVERLAILALESPDERVAVAAGLALCGVAGVAPRAEEGQRIEIVSTVDLDALRATLAARVAGLVLAREPARELEVRKPETVRALPPVGSAQAREVGQSQASASDPGGDACPG